MLTNILTVIGLIAAVIGVLNSLLDLAIKVKELRKVEEKPARRRNPRAARPVRNHLKARARRV